MVRNTDDLYEEVIETYGADHQIMMLFEEMSELQKEICKNFRGRENKDHIIEEMVDVQIMLDQMWVIFGIDRESFDEVFKYKLSRLQKRLEKKKALKGKRLMFTYSLEQESEDPFRELREACRRVGNSLREEMNKTREFVYDPAKYREEEKNED